MTLKKRKENKALKYKLDTPEELEEYRKAVNHLTLEVLDPIAEEIERTDFFPSPDPLDVKMQEMEIHLLQVPKDKGGYGLSFSQWIPIEETGAKGHGLVRLRFHGGGGAQRWTGPEDLAFRGGGAGFALTEPTGGSGLGLMTTAVRKGNNYVINGEKHLITQGRGIKLEKGSLFAVVCRTGDPKVLREKALTTFNVEYGTPGFTVEPMPRAMGYHPLVHLYLKDVVVPVKNVVGREGEGYDRAVNVQHLARVSIGCDCVGNAQRCFELTIEFAKQRVTFGKPIAQRQYVQMMLAEMATDIQAARLLVANAAKKYDEGTMTPKDSSMAKVFAVEMSQRVTDKALLIFGGVGVTKVHKLERLYRDARLLWFEEGSPSIQKTWIVRELLRE